MSYFLKKSRIKKGVYLQIYEGHYDPNKGRAVNTSCRAIGYVDELIGRGIADPVSHFQAEVDRMNEKMRNDRSIERSRQIERSPMRYAGFFLLRTVMSSLNVKGHIDLLQSIREFRFNVFGLLEQLVYSRCVAPCSKRHTFHDVLPSIYGYDGRSASYGQILDGCEFLGSEYEKIVEIFAYATEKSFGTDMSRTYFDCTNFYFEIDREDELRRKGPSKENRHDPIVGLALMLDARLIPIGMKIYPGNESEIPYMLRTIDALKSQNRIKGRTVHVADKGLNCGENIIRTTAAGNGYIFSKSVKKLPDTERTWVLLGDGWNDVTEKDSDGRDTGRVIYRWKRCIDTFGYEYTGDDGRKVSSRVREMRIATYNPKLAEKKRYEIARMAEKARKLSASKAKKDEFGDCGKYVSFRSRRDGVITDDKVVAVINQEAIDRDIELAGYNMLVTSELGMEPADVYGIYHSLWRIEETFRVMKSDLDARPVFLQKSSSIKGHFLICYISVLLERILQFCVLRNRFSSSQIMAFIKGFRVVRTEGKQYVNITPTGDTVKSLSAIFSLPLTNYFLSEADLDRMMQFRIKPENFRADASSNGAPMHIHIKD